VGQITVFGGPERRRRWHEDERMQILTEAFSPGACVAQVARRHDVSTGLIYTWRSKASRTTAASGSSASAGAGFIEAVVIDNGCAEQRPSQPAIVVDLPRGGRVSIYASAPPSVTAVVLKALIR
jgi:transposase